MDITTQQLMNHFERRPVDAYNWACHLFALGFDAPLLEEMIRLGTTDFLADEKIRELLTIIGRIDLLDVNILRREYEAALIQSYFAGEISGSSLIQRCYDLYIGEADSASSKFWSAIADDAYRQSGQFSISLRVEDGFDKALRTAILERCGPRAGSATELGSPSNSCTKPLT